MLGTRVRIQLIVFAVISIVTLTIAAVSYVGLPHMIGIGQYTVKARFADTSGLYARAIVTYRGVDVGIVDSLDLGPDGVTANLAINNGVKIPANAVASVESTSAIGEQYVDLQPSSDDGPNLHNGSVIARTEELPQISPLLDGLNRLLVSVPKGKVTELLANVQTALGGEGPQISSLVAQSQSLLDSAQANLAPTLGLINDAGTVLEQQKALASTTSSAVGYLDTFTTALKSTDGSLRALVEEGPGLAGAFTKLIGDLRPVLPGLLQPLVNVATTLDPYLPALQQLLVLLPSTVAAVQSVLVNPGLVPRTGQVDFKLNLADPPPCSGADSGYIPTSARRAPADTSTASTPRNQYCRTTASDSDKGGRSIRGNRNLPCLSPDAVTARAATVEQCLGIPLAPVASEVSATSSPGKTSASTSADAAPFDQNLNAPTTLAALLRPAGK